MERYGIVAQPTKAIILAKIMCWVDDHDGDDYIVEQSQGFLI